MRRKSDLPRKICQQCGRPMVWRKKWARCWDEVTVCSDRCRSARRPPQQSKQDDANVKRNLNS